MTSDSAPKWDQDKQYLIIRAKGEKKKKRYKSASFMEQYAIPETSMKHLNYKNPKTSSE